MQRPLQQSGRIQITPVSQSTARSAAEQRTQADYSAAVLASFHQQRSALRYYTLGRAREQTGAATDRPTIRHPLISLRLMQPAVEILFEDNHLLVVNKPAGLATMGSGDAASVHRWACDYLRRRYHKPGKVYLGVVHRLDAMTSGALVLARTSKAASRLSAQFRQQTSGPQKIYVAVVAGYLAERQGSFRDRIVKDEAAHRMRVVERSGPRDRLPAAAARASAADPGVEAVLDYRVLRQAEVASGRSRDGNAYSLVAVRLRTGRKHQIRVQFGDRGHIVWGDAKYGDRQNRLSNHDAGGIALHAASLTIAHPIGGRALHFRCQPPPNWGKLLPTPPEWEAAFLPWDDGPETSPLQDVRPLK